GFDVRRGPHDGTRPGSRVVQVAMRTRRLIRRTAVSVTLVAGVVAGAACGGDDTSSEPGEAGDNTEADTTDPDDTDPDDTDPDDTEPERESTPPMTGTDPEDTRPSTTPTPTD